MEKLAKEDQPAEIIKWIAEAVFIFLICLDKIYLNIDKIGNSLIL